MSFDLRIVFEDLFLKFFDFGLILLIITNIVHAVIGWIDVLINCGSYFISQRGIRLDHMYQGVLCIHNTFGNQSLIKCILEIKLINNHSKKLPIVYQGWGDCNHSCRVCSNIVIQKIHYSIPLGKSCLEYLVVIQIADLVSINLIWPPIW